MTDVHGVARDQLRAFIERIERLEEEKKTIADDIKDVYGEAKGTGFDAKILRKLISIRKQDRDERMEQEAILDMYMIALGMLPEAEEFPASNGSPSVPPLADSARDEESVAGEAVGIASVSPSISPETADEHPHHLKTTRGDESGTLEGSVEDHGQVAGCKPESQTDGNETVTVVGDESGTVDYSDQPLIGGDHEVTSIAERDRDIPASNTGEGADSALPAKTSAHNSTKSGQATTEYTPKMGVKRWHLAHHFPSLSKAEVDLLDNDIAANGVHTPIIRQGDVILDGWERYNHSRKYGRAYPVIEYTGTDVLFDLIEWQRAARNFTPAQEKKIAADLAKEFPNRADEIMAAFGHSPISANEEQAA